MTKKNYVCAECGHEQDSMTRTCDQCKSFRVVSIETVEELFGPDWRSAFDAKEKGQQPV